jgi:hypothetical protein
MSSVEKKKEKKTACKPFTVGRKENSSGANLTTYKAARYIYIYLYIYIYIGPF